MNYKKINGQLFRLLEKPEKVTVESKMFLARLIQDNSPIGKQNKQDFHACVLAERTLVLSIDMETFPNTVNSYYEPFNQQYYWRFEIIGYPVAEGSSDWALYQMMHGEKVRHKSYVLPNTHCAMNEKRQIAIFTTPSSIINGGDVICHVNDWLTSRQVDTAIDERTGWQIYYEPELAFKVGDWVECFDKQGQRKLVDYFGGMGCYKTNYDEVISPGEILRKIPPSEIIVKIGCLSGTVRPVSTNGIHIWFHLTGIDDRPIAIIRISCLDIRTRELVEDLLKAQDEEK